jgi:hypothetical protein
MRSVPRCYKYDELVMYLEEAKARNDSAAEDHQQFNRQT